jgi:hypothetical protein
VPIIPALHYQGVTRLGQPKAFEFVIVFRLGHPKAGKNKGGTSKSYMRICGNPKEFE